MYPNYFADKRDVDVIVAGTRLALELVHTSAFKKFGVRLHNIAIPGCEHLQFATDGYWECHLRHYTMLFHHQVLCGEWRVASGEWLLACSHGENRMLRCVGNFCCALSGRFRRKVNVI
jgi:hypothetical protein